jgi:hypothetical protein
LDLDFNPILLLEKIKRNCKVQWSKEKFSSRKNNGPKFLKFEKKKFLNRRKTIVPFNFSLAELLMKKAAEKVSNSLVSICTITTIIR